MPNIIYLTTSEAAEKLRTSKQMLLRYLRNGTLPVSPRILGAKMLWIESEIDAFLADSFYQPKLKKVTQKQLGRPSKASQMLSDAAS